MGKGKEEGSIIPFASWVDTGEGSLASIREALGEKGEAQDGGIMELVELCGAEGYVPFTDAEIGCAEDEACAGEYRVGGRVSLEKIEEDNRSLFKDGFRRVVTHNGRYCVVVAKSALSIFGPPPGGKDNGPKP